MKPHDWGRLSNQSMVLAGDNCCELPLERIKKIEATSRVAAANKINIESLVVAVLSQLDDIFTLQKVQKIALKAFFLWKRCVYFTSADFSKSFDSVACHWGVSFIQHRHSHQ